MKIKQEEFKIKNWYADKYTSARIQRNLFFLIALLSSVSVLACLILVKYVYENRSIEPYLLSIDKRDGSVGIVDYQTVEKFTASDIFRESNVINFVKLFEGYRKETNSEDENKIRIFSSKAIYEKRTSQISELDVRNDIKNKRYDRVDVVIISIDMQRSKIANVKIRRDYYQNDEVVEQKYININIIFDFFDLKLPLNERYINPLGFQVVNYESREEFVNKDIAVT